MQWKRSECAVFSIRDRPERGVKPGVELERSDYRTRWVGEAPLHLYTLFSLCVALLYFFSGTIFVDEEEMCDWPFSRHINN